MKSYLIISLISFALISCGDCPVKKELESSQNQVNIANERIDYLESQLNRSGELTHIVLFDIKEGHDMNMVFAQMQKLSEIPGVKNFSFGPYKDLGDSRAASQYEMALSMTFADSTAYKLYQTHPIHLSAQSATRESLAGPPMSYDYISQ